MSVFWRHLPKIMGSWHDGPSFWLCWCLPCVHFSSLSLSCCRRTEAMFQGLGTATLKFPRSLLNISKWGTFFSEWLFSWVFFQMSFQLGCKCWGMVCSVRFPAHFTGHQSRAADPGAAAALMDRCSPLTVQSTLCHLCPGRVHPQTKCHRGVACNRRISEHFLSWISEQYGASGHWTHIQGCTRARGSQQKSATLQWATTGCLLGFRCPCPTRTGRAQDGPFRFWQGMTGSPTRTCTPQLLEVPNSARCSRTMAHAIIGLGFLSHLAVSWCLLHHCLPYAQYGAWEWSPLNKPELLS